MKKILFIIGLLFSLNGSAQLLQYVTTYGYEYNRVGGRTWLFIPSDTLPISATYAAYAHIAKKGTALYYWNGTIWAPVVAGGGMVYPGAGIPVSTGSAWGTSITDNSANWNTAYTDRLKWDGGATGLTAVTGRTSLGGTTIGQNIFTSTNPSAITFLRANADNTVDWLSAANFRTAIGAGTSTVTPAALTRTDDTNVTLTLTGTPGTALLQAVGLGLGWTGDLAFSRLTQIPGLSVLGVTGGSTADVAGITGTNDQFLRVRSGALGFGSIVAGDLPDLNTLAWKLTGNSGTVAGTNFIGTTDAVDFVIKTQGGEIARFSGDLLSRVSIGGNATATGQSSIAIGSASTTASGDGSIAMGDGTIASGEFSVTTGSETRASGAASTAIGNSTLASGASSTAMGEGTVASGDRSTSIGDGTKSKSFGGTVIGAYNDSTNATSATTFSTTNRAFQIGIGTADNARANAMTVLFSGKTTLNKYGVGTFTGTPAYTLQVNSSGDIIEGSVAPMVYPGAGIANSTGSAWGTSYGVTGSPGNVVLSDAPTGTGTWQLAAINQTGRYVNTLNGAASTPPVIQTGTWFTGGTSTTTKPQVSIEPTGTTSTGWSTAGTGIGVNAASGFTGNLIDAQLNGTSSFKVTSGGVITGVGTNITGTAAGLTAGDVTTNANLTGPVTSAGNATAIADAALSIAKTSGLQAALDLKAPLASPTFTGTPTLPTGTIGVTQSAGNSTTALATTAFVTTADNLKANIASPTFTGTVTIPTPFTLGAVSVLPTGTELNFVDGVTSAIQTQIDAKQATITFGTGVQTALGVNIGSAGAPVLFNGAGGTPSSLVVTNASGTASININGTVGATTAAAGLFTTVGATGNVSLATASAGIVTIGGGATASKIRFMEPSGSGSHRTDFQAVAQGADITYSLPPTVGAAGTFLKDVAGDGVLSWATPAGGGGTTNNVTPTARLATAAALPANTYLLGALTGVSTGTLTVDGVVTAINDIILVKNEAAGENNGLYTVTTAGAIGVAYILTRHTSQDATGEFVGAVMPIASEGTVNKNTEWRNTNATAPTVGTTAITNEIQYLGAATAITVNATTGFQVAGAAASRKILVGNGTNYVTSTETWAVPGTSGNILTSDGTNWTSAAGTTILKAYQVADAVYTLDATLNNTDLNVTVATGGIYRIEADAFLLTGAGLSLLDFDGGSATFSDFRAEYFTAYEGFPTNQPTSSPATDFLSGADGTEIRISVVGYINVSAGGTLILRASQNASNASSTTFYKGSNIILTKLN